jgi:hypothetical protein
LTDDTVTSVDMDDLDNFSKSFYNDEPVKQEESAKEKTEEEVPENGDDTPATDVDEDAAEEEEPQEDETEEVEEPEEEPKPKGKKSAKDRIEELYAANKHKDRELAELRAAVEALKTPTEVKTSEKPKATSDAPKPDAVDEKGEAIYPMGEYDPDYIRDLHRHFIAEERKIAEAEAAKKQQEDLVKSAQAELTSAWVEKVAAAEEELPDLREHLASMESIFADIEPSYGEFLAAAIMSCDNGPQIMYHLSQNIGEAQKIVASGPQAAILALGKLDERFTKPTASEKRNTKTVSKAAEPPVSTTRGNTGKTSVPADTTDLKAFEREFYKK